MPLEIQNAAVINYSAQHFDPSEYVRITTENETNYFFEPSPEIYGAVDLVLEWSGMDEELIARVREACLRWIDPDNQLPEEERTGFELRLRSDSRFLPLYRVAVVAIGEPLAVTYVEEKYSKDITLPGGPVAEVSVPWSTTVGI